MLGHSVHPKVIPSKLPALNAIECLPSMYPCGKLPGRLLCSHQWLCASPTQPFTTTISHPPVAFSLQTHPLDLAIFLPFPMSQSSSTFQALFSAALQDYKDKTGNTLIDHPFAKQLEMCDSVNSIATILQEQAQSFREFSENDGKLMKALNSSVDILCLPSISSALAEAIGFVVHPKTFIDTLFLMAILQPFPPANAIFTGIAILLTVCISSSNPIWMSP
jgi:hypothetical protein